MRTTWVIMCTGGGRGHSHTLMGWRDLDATYPSGQPRGLSPFNTLRERQNGRNLADDIFKCIFLNENVWIPIKISLKFVRKGPINNIPALVQIMAWRRSDGKPLSEPMMVILPMHICVTLPQWVNVAAVPLIVSDPLHAGSKLRI